MWNVLTPPTLPPSPTACLNHCWSFPVLPPPLQALPEPVFGLCLKLGKNSWNDCTNRSLGGLSSFSSYPCPIVACGLWGTCAGVRLMAVQLIELLIYGLQVFTTFLLFLPLSPSPSLPRFTATRWSNKSSNCPPPRTGVCPCDNFRVATKRVESRFYCRCDLSVLYKEFYFYWEIQKGLILWRLTLLLRMSSGKGIESDFYINNYYLCLF